MQKMEAPKGPGDDTEEPSDTYRMAYLIHFILGAGNLVPWNAFITAIDYFGHLYPEKHIEKVFSVAYMSSSLLILLVMVCWGSWGKRLSFRLRLNMGFSMFVLSLIVAPVLDWSSCSNRSKERSNGAYSLSVASVVICGLADGLIGGSLIGYAGKLPKQYMQALFAGTASSGVLVSILRIITKASVAQTAEGLRTSAHLYFLVSIVILLGCILCCNLLFKLEFIKQHYRLDRDHDNRVKFWNVARKVRWPALGVLMIYAVTLSIFPGFIADNLESRVLRDWYPILLITLYNIMDFIGKSLTAVYVLRSVGKATWSCLGRILFYPLFTACLHGPRWLRTEVPVIFLTAMLGLSNGYLTSNVMILAPKSVPASEAEISAIVMAVFLGMGLVTGSILGWLWII